jgi:glycosyltransferase involved in cell wall biosynthesis
MKAVCISCFDHYATRMKSITEYLCDKGYDTTYIITDFQHYSKVRYQAKYNVSTIQLHVPAYIRNMSTARLMSHFIFANKVYEKLYEIKPDIIYCMFPPNMLVKRVIQYKYETGVKVIFDCYDMWPESFPYEKYGKLLSLPFGIWRKFRDQYIEKADMLVCVSNALKDTFSKNYKGVSMTVLMPSISINNMPEYTFDNEKKITFCYLGNINHITDIELGIELLSTVVQKRPVVLHIIGGGQNHDDFVHGLAASGIEVISHGVVFDDETKKQIFSQCNFGLNIPREGIQSTMSLKSIEYMHVGLPFINSGVGDTYNIVNANGVGINIDRMNIDMTVETILNVSNKELRNMHDCCVTYYVNNFANQNLDDVFSEVLF